METAEDKLENIENSERRGAGRAAPTERPFRSHYNLWLKTISAVVIAAFVLQDLSFANGGAAINIAIPNESGHTRRASIQNTDEIIINIQDAHSKLCAQESISNILDSLVKNYNLKLVAME